ncbi:MAG: MnhB domain-containing protein [Pseudomonadota bacterium]
MTSPLLQAAARILVAMMLLFSLFMLLRGHNEPGGGFIGGLIAAAAFSLLAASHGVAAARRALRAPPQDVAAAGVAAALIAGLIPALTGEPPFAGLWAFIGGAEAQAGADGAAQKPTGLPISTVLLFDIGVWLVVLGSVLSLVFALEEEEG